MLDFCCNNSGALVRRGPTILRHSVGGLYHQPTREVSDVAPTVPLSWPHPCTVVCVNGVASRPQCLPQLHGDGAVPGVRAAEPGE